MNLAVCKDDEGAIPLVDFEHRGLRATVHNVLCPSVGLVGY